MASRLLQTFQVLSLVLGVSQLLLSWNSDHVSIFTQAILQWGGAIGIVQAIALNFWRFRKILIRSGFPRLLSPQWIVFHIALRSSLFCGIIISFLMAIKLSFLSTPTRGAWNPLEGIFFSIGLGLLTQWIYWHRDSIQNFISHKVGIEFWRKVSLSILIFTRVLFASVGIVCTSLVVMADWLGLDPTPGWGMTRKIQFAAGLTLLLSSYLLYDRSIHFWLMKKFGREFLKTIRNVVAWVTRAILLFSGITTMVLVAGADWLGLDPTPGWGWPRRLQFLAGLLLVLSGIFLQNQFFKRWSYQMMGLKVLSPTQVTLIVLGRAMVVVSGLIITILVFIADWLHLDPTPGWSESRFFQLAAGIALIASGFISHHTSLLRWQLRKLFD